MKRTINFKPLLASLVAMLVSVNVNAHDAVIDGIYYNLVSKAKQATVTYQGDNNKSAAYSGSVTIPSTVVYEGVTYDVTSIGTNAFYRCTDLTSITIPSSVTSIGEYAFGSCSGLTSMTIPSSVTSIGSSAFNSCSNLTSVVIPSSIMSIESRMFYKCTNLTSMTIPSSVSRIESEAFYECVNLTLVSIPPSVEYLGWSAFSGCSGLVSVTVPSSVSGIQSQTFYNCTGLTSVIIEGDGYIHDQAFYKCSRLTTITLNVGSIQTKAFADCPELLDVYCNSETPPSVASDAFEGSYIDYVTLHVPAIGASAYASDPVWGCFKEILPMTIEEVTSVELSCQKLTLELGKDSTLTANVLPDYAEERTLVWTSSDESVATVDSQGNVTAIDEGEALIIATATDGSGKADTCRLTVTQICTLIADYGDRIDTLYSRGMLPKIELSDIVQSVRSLIDCSAETLTYSRTYKSTSWQAWYVPFDLTLTNDVLEDFSFAKFAGTYTEDDGTFYISITRMNEGDVVKANTPYLVQAKVADSENPQVITLTDATLYASRETGFSMYSAEKKVTVQGVYSRKEVTEEDRGWYALSGGKYSQQNKLGNALSSFRFYLTITDREDNPYASSPNPAEVKIKVLGEDADGVTPLSVSPEEEKPAVYDLSGRRIAEDKATKGIYIINGKKVFVK